MPWVTMTDGPGGTEQVAQARNGSSPTSAAGQGSADAGAKILESSGFTKSADGKTWRKPGGTPATLDPVRKTVFTSISRQAKTKKWSDEKTLWKLGEASSVFPVSEQLAIARAAWFLPIVEAAGGPGAFGVPSARSVKLPNVPRPDGSFVRRAASILGRIGTVVTLPLLLSSDTPQEQNKKNEPLDKSGAAVTIAAKEEERETVTVYRVEGKENQRILIDGSGNVMIVGNAKKMLHLNFGDRKRAEEFFRIRLDQPHLFTGVSIKSFKVPKTFLELLRAAAIQEHKVRELRPESARMPRFVDSDVALDQFQLPREWIELLRPLIIQGTGREERQPAK